jgi:acyl-CoA reductase-like NAD-dependent aldehyde dehydrogenase
MKQLQSLNPATDEVVATYDTATDEEVFAAVDRAKETAEWWRGIGYDGRKKRLIAWKRYLAAHSDELIDLMHRENGKPKPDATLELLLALEHTAWSAKHAGKVLKPEKRKPGMLFANFSARTEHVPYGVVGVIGPWNYPVYTPNGSIATALAAGNTVVYKPSEHTPAIGQWYADAYGHANPGDPDGVLTVVQGYGATGAALCRSGVQKLAFTGSAATGKKVMAACSENLVPVVMELGGKDAAIVAADADLAKAAELVAWGAASNGGQTCTGVERVYVEEEVRDEFLGLLTKELASVKPGSGPGASYGPMTMPSQLKVVRKHVEDAIGSGGQAVVGGLSSVGDRYVEPVVLVDVPEDSLAVQEETFGPTVTVTTVRDLDEAVRLSNAVNFGLGASVFSKRRGAEVAERLDTGMVSINSVLGFAGMGALPFGGRADSGFGRIHGPEGLREFTRPRSVAVQRFAIPGMNLTSFNRPKAVDKLLPAMLRLLHKR